MKWEIKYYLTETAFRSGVVSHRETITGDRQAAVHLAEIRIRTGSFKYYELEQKQ